jgi:hypothetical protein
MDQNNQNKKSKLETKNKTPKSQTVLPTQNQNVLSISTKPRDVYRAAEHLLAIASNAEQIFIKWQTSGRKVKLSQALK